jgi:hypothetical protein
MNSGREKKKKKVEQRNTHVVAFSLVRGPEDAAGSRRGHGGDQTWNWRTEGQQTATAGYDGQGHTTTETNTRIHPLAECEVLVFCRETCAGNKLSLSRFNF